jgi:hypothetical protein
MNNRHCEQPDQTRIVTLLSEESHVPPDEVATLYERESASLAVGPHVPNFLHVFAIRNVRETLQSRHGQADAAVETLPGPAAVERLDTAVMTEARKDFRSNVEHALRRLVACLPVAPTGPARL